uniref:Retrotransposon protein, putative, Ty1-copia subclass n=1 Tax=Tanacetum cinerariifolium TaxID=118510 RepID=A0A6L2LU65_TANCI|nr:hypothetical protein [Tanacetum cinerariifolium]
MERIKVISRSLKTLNLLLKSTRKRMTPATTVNSNGIYEIDMSNLVPNVNSIYNVNNKRFKHNLDSTYLWHFRLAHISKKHIEKMQHDGLLKLTDDESFDKCVSCLSGKMTRKSFLHRPERVTDLLGLTHTDVCGPLRHVSRQDASYFITFTDDYSRYGYIYLLKHTHEVFETFKLTPPYTPQHNGVSERRNRTLLDMLWGCEALVKWDTPDKLQQRSVKCIFIGYPKETMGYYFYFPLENKIVVAGYAKFFMKKLLSQEVSERAGELEEIQDEDTSPSEITSKIPMKVEGFKPPQEEVIPVHRSITTHQAPECLCLNVEMQSMKDNQVRRLNDLPPDCKTIGSKWLFKKKTDMDGNVHTYKARLVANGFTQLYEVDYEEMFSHVTDIRAIRILIAIVAFYDYEIWMVNSKHGYIPMQERLDLNKTQGASTPREVMRMQNVPYASAVEAEYITASEAEMEVVWIGKFISRLGIVPIINEPIKMFCDNSAAFLIANEPRVQRGARHYHRRYLLKVHIYKNLVDPFTKALSKGKLTQHARNMRIR